MDLQTPLSSYVFLSFPSPVASFQAIPDAALYFYCSYVLEAFERITAHEIGQRQSMKTEQTPGEEERVKAADGGGRRRQGGKRRGAWEG